MSKTIEPDGSQYSVFEHGVYDHSSVLEGQYRRSFKGRYDTVTGARKAHPGADVVEHSTRRSSFGCESLSDLSGLQTSPPAWFDPADAGERWDEDY